MHRKKKKSPCHLFGRGFFIVGNSDMRVPELDKSIFKITVATWLKTSNTSHKLLIFLSGLSTGCRVSRLNQVKPP